MENNYAFICIGTNKIISDSFGPRVGEKLQKIFYNKPEIRVYGTMREPIHFKNAVQFLENLDLTNKIILIDSAFGNKENIGNTYVNFGGIEIGKAFGKSIFFPGDINIKTVVGSKEYMPKYSVREIENLAENAIKRILEIR